MSALVRSHWQTALVIVLFVSSLAVLLFNAFSALVLPRREAEMREQLRQASSRLAREAAPVLDAWFEPPPPKKGRKKGPKKASLEKENDELARVSRRVLADFPGVEGGFYLNARLDRFSGYAYPTGPNPTAARSEPPPLEAPHIRRQARESLDLPPGEILLHVRDVGPSRVVVATEPVGRERPARAATWLIHRLTHPEQLERQIFRYQLANGLALGGILVALLLTLHLGRSLRRQRQREDRLREELRRSEHLASLGKLLAGVAHEVRNPLAGIRSTVQLWERLPETARNPETMAAVIRAVDRLNEIVSRLLHFSRADAAQRHPVAVNGLLTETLKLIEVQAAEQGVRLQADLQENLPGVSGSAGGLRQVFLNLASNALQAMPEGGVLRCDSRAAPDGKKVFIRFSDTGPGISAEERGHLFEPFFTTRPDGTGLGLALCREIVAQHGGEIRLENGEGSGAVFRVALPANRV